MKPTACFLLLFAILGTRLLSQTKPVIDQDLLKSFQKQLVLDNVDIWVSSGVAEKLLIHKVDWECPAVANSLVTGTVVVAFEIGRNGDVLHPMVISGPLRLHARVLDAVRKYKYKPYLLNGKAVEVATTVYVAVDLNHGCPLIE